MEPLEAKAIIEALIFAAETPLSLTKLEQILSPCPQEDVERLLNELQQEYNCPERGLQLVKVAGGYQFTTKPQLAAWVKKLLKEKESRRLSTPALETLAIIAYKQPIMRAEIEAIRGVDVSGILNSLLEKSLVRITGRREGPGRPLLYSTTDEFMLYFGLQDLDDLPKIEEVIKKEE